jgi:CheY-like chemotaxis protein
LPINSAVFVKRLVPFSLFCFLMALYKNILLVEDDLDDQDDFLDLVKEIDPKINCVVTGNGLKAMMSIVTNETLPELIFLDIHMPNIDGYDFLHALRTNTMYDAFKNIPVVVLSGAMRNEEKFAALGAHIAITKPFSLDVYKAILAIVLEHDVVKESAKIKELIAEQVKKG